MQALVLGTLLAVAALAYVLFPLFVEAMDPRGTASGPGATADGPDEEAVVALREIEFDRATGKLSDADYSELRARYTERALDAMRLADAAPAADPVEAVVLAYRARLKACVQCGPRPEPDAIYCSNCGGYLRGACAGCGATVSESGAAFCASCGRTLAA
jgi:hypothetical protein